MSIRVHTGLAGSGKTSAIIRHLQQLQREGKTPRLYLSSEHEELTRRSNVHAGGLMGCRNPALSHTIEDVVDTSEAVALLAAADHDDVLAFDEAQFFSPEIVAAWQKASARGVDVIVGTPSDEHLKLLETVTHEMVSFQIACSCGSERATCVFYDHDLTYPQHLCENCYEKRMNEDIQRLLEDVKKSEPFPGELHTYQPFHGIDMDGWQLVRGDSRQRLDIVLNAIARAPKVAEAMQNAVQQPTFIDLGCCSGFFADGMSEAGFISAGVDVDENFINWGSRLARIKGQATSYTQSDLFEFLTTSEKNYDVISTFATVQWVMAQRGYQAGVRCFEEIFKKVKAVAVIEMGYTSEDIYRDKIADRPTEIDRDWVLNLMQESGDFSHVEVHPAGENGIWRDIFVGFVDAPLERSFAANLPLKGANQISESRGHSDDDWVETSFEIYLQATQDLTQFTLEGWRPDGSKATEISVSISMGDGQGEAVKPGVFTSRIPIDIEKGSRFRLSINTADAIDAPDDQRSLGFVLRKLTFS